MDALLELVTQNAAILTVLGALVVNGFVALSRKTGVNVPVLALIGSGIVSGLYIYFTETVDVEMQTRILDTASKVLALQWVIYEAIIRPWKNRKNPNPGV